MARTLLMRLQLNAVLVLGIGALAPSERSKAATVEDADVVAAIDEALKQSWRDAGVVPSRPAPDASWARRIYLDLLGRVPRIEELEEFVAQPKPSRREWLVDRLLGEELTEDRARWRSIEWANLLVGRTGGRTGNSLVEREPFEEYLREAFAENRPYDQLATELVTATGSVRPQDEDFNPAANFLADKMAESGVQATAMTARVFLGQAVQCTQCHDHPFNEGRQNQFWELNAFFRQTRVERVRDEGRGRPKARIVSRDYFGERRGSRRLASLPPGEAESAESFYELRNGKLRVAYPVFLDGTSLSDVFLERGHEYGDSGRLEHVDRRGELADLVVASPDFARATVNREWGRFFGEGFSQPVDDMGPHNPPSHPELLESIAQAFRDSGHDLQRLSRWIVLSKAYGLDSRMGRSNQEDDPSQGEAPLFSRFYLRQLSAEQIYESLMVATRADETLSEERRDDARRRWARQFATAFGDDENSESTSFDGSIPQVLAMMNSPLVRRATSLHWKDADKGSESAPREPAGFLSSVAADRSLSNAERVDQLYLAALARKPDRKELAVCNQLLAARNGNAGQALRDVWWALLNSNEFILQH